MPIEAPEKKNKATPFELEIYAEMHNIININDEFKTSKANILILTKLLSVVKKEDDEKAQEFISRLRTATSPNISMVPANILGKKGWEIKDSRGGLVIPATPDSLEIQNKFFLQMQYRKINTELNIIIIDVLTFLMSRNLFLYNSEREGDLYDTLLTGRNTKEEDDFA